MGKKLNRKNREKSIYRRKYVRPVRMKRIALQPDFMFRTIYDITPALLREQGFSAVIFDIDNTVAPYTIAEPTARMTSYLRALDSSGIKVAFASNNNEERVALFNKNLGYFYVHNAKKPSAKALKKCIKSFGCDKSSVVCVGDQLFTDCLAAHRAGVQFYMVQPIQKVESVFFKLKRALEKPFICIFKSRLVKATGGK